MNLNKQTKTSDPIKQFQFFKFAEWGNPPKQMHLKVTLNHPCVRLITVW